MKTSNAADLKTILGAADPYVGTLPEIAKARGGTIFCPQRDLWELWEGVNAVKLNFESLPNLDKGFKQAFKSAMLWYVENQSISHVRNMFFHSKYLFQFKCDELRERITEITDADLLNYRGSLDRRKFWYLSSLSGFLQKWAQLGLPGISKGAVALLKELHLKGNEKGVAVATHDPVVGPFSDLEIEGLQSALNTAYAQHRLGTAEYLLCWLVMLLGQRPTQYAALKVSDVLVVHKNGRAATYAIRMPRAKRRDSNARGEFKERVITPEIGVRLAKYAREVQTNFAEILEDSRAAPLFPGRLLSGAIGGGYEYHQTALSIGAKIKNAMSRLQVRSERTGEFINITPRRFRHTVGTPRSGRGPW